MPRYFFHATAGHAAFDATEKTRPTADTMNQVSEYRDENGVVLSSNEEAVAYGRRVATELAEERRWHGYVIAVTDQNGAEVARIPVVKPAAGGLERP